MIDTRRRLGDLRIRTADLRHFTLLVALVQIACSGTTTPPPKVETRPRNTLPSSRSTVVPARWTGVGGSTLIGPTLREGTLVLLGGRRVLVKGAEATFEAVPAPQGLVSVISLPSTGSSQTLITYSDDAIYRLDDPLGAPVLLARTDGATVARVVPVPGFLAVWTRPESEPRFPDEENAAAKPPFYIDMRTPRLSSPPGLPSVPVIHVAFKNDKEGIALFQLVGPAETKDGGATWTPTKLDESTVDAMKRGRPVFEEDRSYSAHAGEAPVVKWIRLTEIDPLVAAARSGVFLPSGELLISAKGVIARADARTGLVSQIVHPTGDDDASTDELEDLSLARARDTVWFYGRLPSREERDGLRLHYGLFSIDLRGKDLTPHREWPASQLPRSVIVAPNGGVMVKGACNVKEYDLDDTTFCVRHPTRNWVTVRPDFDLSLAGAAPLADGRIVYLRGTQPGETPPQDVSPSRKDSRPRSPDGDPASAPEDGRSWLVALDSCGQEETLATLAWPNEEPRSVVAPAAIQEIEDGRLRVVLRSKYVADNSETAAEIFVASAAGTGDTVKPVLVKDASWARLAGKSGIATGPGGLLISADGGTSWKEMAAPKQVGDWLATHGPLAPALEDDLGHEAMAETADFHVSDAGVKMGSFVRIGWGDAEPLPTRPPLEGGVLLRSVPPTGNPEHVIRCSTNGSSSGAPPPRSYESYRQGYWGKEASRKTFDRVTYFRARGAIGVAKMPASAAVPMIWSLFWLDNLEIGARPRSIPGPPLQGITSPTLSTFGMTASGDRALFSFKAGPKHLVGLVRGTRIDVAEVTAELVPTSQSLAAISAEDGAPIAWIADGNIVVWRTGEAPRSIATFEKNVHIELGQATKDGVPVILDTAGKALMKVIPVPLLDPKDKNARPAVHSRDIWLKEDWTPLHVDFGELSRLEACRPDMSGRRILFKQRRGSIRVEVDGTRQILEGALYALRFSEDSVCVEGLAGHPEDEPLPPDSPVMLDDDDDMTPSTGAPARGRVDFLRFDISRRKAEGGRTGLPVTPTKGKPNPPPMLRTLGCKYEVAAPPSPQASSAPPTRSP